MVSPALPEESFPSQQTPENIKPSAVPTHEEIAIRAYLISENRQRYGIMGNEVDDWAQAQAELLAEVEEAN